MSHRFLKILSINTFILIFLSLVLIKNSPATGYELSIYSSTSPLLWIFLIIGNFFGIIILVYNKENKNNTLIGFFILILINFIILSLFAMRGYYFYNIGDSIEHFTITSRIISSGIFNSDNVYPITHVLIAEIAEISNLEIQQVMGYLPPFFSILFMVSVLLLANLVLQNQRGTPLAVAASSIFLFSYYHISVYPSGFSVLILPLLFYLYFKSTSSSSEFKGLFLILLIAYTFFHPSTSLMLTFFLLTLEMTKIICKSEYTFKPVLISTTLYILWNTQFWIYDNTIKNIFSPILGQNNSHTQDSYFITEGVKAVQNVQGLDLIELSLKMYGVHIIYSILSLLAIVMIIKRGLKYYDKTLLNNMYMLFAIFLIGAPVSFIIFLSTKVISIGRLLGLNYVMVVTPILVGFSLIELIEKFNNKNTIKMISVIIISMSFILTTFSAYRSPWILQQNWQATYSYIDALKWFQDRQSNIASQGFGFYQVTNPAFYRYGNVYMIPEHFNYSVNETLGEQIEKKRYIIITEMSKLANANPILAKSRIDSAIQWGFNDSDFYKFENDDISIDRLYSNGELNVYIVEPIKYIRKDIN